MVTPPNEARRSKAMVNPVLEDLPPACQHQHQLMVNRVAGPCGGRQRRERLPGAPGVKVPVIRGYHNQGYLRAGIIGVS